MSISREQARARRRLRNIENRRAPSRRLGVVVAIDAAQDELTVMIDGTEVDELLYAPVWSPALGDRVTVEVDPGGGDPFVTGPC